MGYESSSIWKPIANATKNVGTTSPRNLIMRIMMAIQFRTNKYTSWIGDVITQAKTLHQDHSFDVVYSRSPPPIAHSAGYWCAKKLNATWVANINDPWDLFLAPNSQAKTSSLHKLISKYWLNKTLRCADLVTYPSKRLYDFHTQLTRLSHKAEIIPHVGYRINANSQVDKFNLVHAGKLGLTLSTYRSSKGLLMGISKFLLAHPDASKITKLTLVGEDKDRQSEDKERRSITKNMGLKDIVRSVGWVSYEQSLQYINSASLCILVEGPMVEGIFFPSKFVDYIAAKKPVLALSPSVGVIADIIPSRGVFRVDADDHDAVAKALSFFYKRFKEGTLDEVSPSEEFVTKYEPQSVAQQFIAAIEKVRQKCC
jgi:glycosyltransferase involved in cell wall biosynthesis